MTVILAALALLIPAVTAPGAQMLDEAATASAPATRVDPPGPQFADACDEMSWYRQQAGLPAVFDRIGWRESRCRNEDGVRTFCCVSWWQLWVDLHLRDPRLAPAYHACGVYGEGDVNSDTAGDKQRAACATKALYSVMGLSPWAATA